MKALTLYRPRFFENALSEFDSYVDSFFRDNFLSRPARAYNRIPPVDVREAENAYVIEAELPGFDEKDIQIRLDGSTLTIECRREDEKKPEGQTEEAKPEQDCNYLIRERALAAFSRSFKLPENADHEGITASFRNGVLSVGIVKKAEAQKRLIEISKN